MRKKYPFHPDFKKWEHMNPPINKFAIFIIQKAMNLIYYKQKSDAECDVKRIKIPYNKTALKALIFSPKCLIKNSPCLVYYHGGGFVLPASSHHYNKARQYAIGAKCKVIFIDYPLAPKHKYPIPVEASYQTYKWIVENAESLSINKNKIAVGGDSAGGNIASIVSLMASDNKIIMPCGQMLIYPAIGLDEETNSMKEFTDTPMCNSKDYAKYTKQYLKNEEDKKTRYISPIRADNYSIFPPSYIETAQFDCLRDEAIIFAYILKRAGVKVFYRKTKGTMHGYDIVEKSNITIESVKKRIEFLKTVFKNKT